ITLDTLRYDALACDGVLPWMQTPHIDALAADGVLFEQAISQAPSTTPSHCSIMTSVYPNVHDALNGKPMRRNLPTLAQCLRENGYETSAFTSSTTTRSISTGLDRGFEHYVDSLVSWSELFGRDEFQNLLVFYMLGIAQDSQIRGAVVTQRALRWLDQRGATPFFCWLHYFDPHEPYDPPAPYDALYAGSFSPNTPMRAEREAYAGEVTYTDAQVGKIVAALKDRGLYDDTLIIVVADHGEGFGEKHWAYTERGHAEHLYDTTQHVPLIIKPARIAAPPRGRRIRNQVELIDIAPTVLAYLQLPAPAMFAGHSLASALRGEAFPDEHRPAHAMTWVEAYDPNHPDQPGSFVRKLAHRTPDWKYIVVDHYNQEELYNLRRDPAERKNVAPDEKDLCAERMAEVKAAMPTDRDTREDPRLRLAPAIRKQLEALGYLGSHTDETPSDDQP
ncbi:MAG TPA: sulfatase, partial [Phycisphaerae bacterium]|nr:sulfatase [Phycisphaerae bacterium]